MHLLEHAATRRRLGIALIAVGIVLIVVNAFLQQTTSAGFFPIGAVGAFVLGEGYWAAFLYRERQ